MQNKKKPYAVVLGLDHINGIQTVRILANHRIPIIGIAKDPDHYCVRTRLCEKILFTDTSSEALIDSLVQIGPTLGTKAVLYPCTDAIVSIVSYFFPPAGNSLVCMVEFTCLQKLRDLRCARPCKKMLPISNDRCS